MRIIVFGNSQVNLLRQGYKFILENPSDFSICPENYREELSKHVFKFLGLPGPNFKNMNITLNGRIIVPQYVYSVKTGEIIYENKFQEISSKNFDVVIWAQGPNVLTIYWNLIGNDNQYPTLLSSSLLDVIYKKEEFEHCKINSKIKLFHVGSPNPFKRDLSLIEKSSSENLEIHKRNLLFMKSYLDKKHTNISYIYPPNECLESNYKYTLTEFASKPGKDFVHANKKYGAKILNSIIANLLQIK